MQHLQRTFEKEPDTCCICVNFRDGDENELTLESINASLLTQLLFRRRQLHHGHSDQLKTQFREFQLHQTPLTREESTELLNIESEAFTKKFLIVDALETCSSHLDPRIQANFMERIRQLSANWNVLVTVRSGASIGNKISSDHEISVKAHDSDIKLYIESRIAPISNPQLGNMIGEIVVARSNGMLVAPFSYLVFTVRMLIC